MICPTCKGSGKQTIKVTTHDQDGVTESESTITCIKCKGSGEVDKAKHEAEVKAAQEFWCSCGNPSEDMEYYEFIEDGHRYHGWNCGDCGKVVQVG